MPVLYVLGNVFYFVSYYLLKLRRPVVIANLSKTFSHFSAAQINSLAKTFYHNYAEVIAEMLKTFSIPPEMLAKRVHIENIDLLQNELGKGQSVIVLSAHLCNVDWLMVATQLKLGYPVDVVYKPRHIESIDMMFIKSHQRFGAYPVSTKDTARETVRRKNVVRAIALAADLAPRESEDKLWLEFLSRSTAFFQGPEKLAHMMKYPVYFMSMKRIRRGYYRASVKQLTSLSHIESDQVITRRYAQEVEAQILLNPADWLWSHQRWKYSKPD